MPTLRSLPYQMLPIRKKKSGSKTKIATGGKGMASDQFTRVINHAFLSELKDCNVALWDDVALLGSYAQEPFSAEWIEQNAGQLLHRLREQLSCQFRLEETFGYVIGPGDVQDKNVTKAIGQHFSLMLQCTALSEQLDELEYCGKLSSETHEMWRQMKRLYEAIMEHEALERRLVAAAWAPILPEAANSVEHRRPFHQEAL